MFNKKQTYLEEADEALLQHIYSKSPKWLYDHKPFWVIFKHPEWVAQFEPKDMLQVYPHYMVKHKPEVVAHLDPELLWFCDFDKLVQFNPRWLIRNKRPQIAYMKPSLLSSFDPVELKAYRSEESNKKTNRIWGWFLKHISSRYQTARVEHIAIPKEFMPDANVNQECSTFKDSITELTFISSNRK